MTLLFVFDMDGVLYDYDYDARQALLAEVTGLPVAELQRRWWRHPDGEAAAEAGAYADADAYLAAFTAAIGVDVGEEEWVRVRGAAMVANHDVIAVAARATELGAISLLTNNGPLVGRHLPRLAPALVPVFGAHLHTSSEFGARKPDREVFERVTAAHGGTPERTFFVDNEPEYVDGARAAGLTAHHFDGDAAALRAAVENFAAAEHRLH